MSISYQLNLGYGFKVPEEVAEKFFSEKVNGVVVETPFDQIAQKFPEISLIHSGDQWSGHLETYVVSKDSCSHVSIKEDSAFEKSYSAVALFNKMVEWDDHLKAVREFLEMNDAAAEYHILLSVW